jgi:hypothetical protein
MVNSRKHAKFKLLVVQLDFHLVETNKLLGVQLVESHKLLSLQLDFHFIEQCFALEKCGIFLMKFPRFPVG